MKIITRFTVNYKKFFRLLCLCLPLVAILILTNVQAAYGAKIESSELAANTYSFIALSTPADDGWILESAEPSNRSGSMNNKTMLIVGDDAKNRQYRSMLSFNTADLPDNAIITDVTVKIKKVSLQGNDPFVSHGNLVADIKNGYFDTAQALQLSDFSAAATSVQALIVGKTANAGWYTGKMSATALKSINKQGITQFLLRFTKDDDNDKKADNISFYAGEAAPALKPQLVVTYTLPQDGTTPAQINSLTAQSGSVDSTISITWIAPGDDGKTGTATTYQVRYSPTEINSETAWSKAIPVTMDVPTPAVAGTKQQMTIHNLVAGKIYYVAVRASDEASNLGSLSNSPNAQAKQENTAPESAVISTAGGKLVADAGEVAVTFPVGAVAEPVTVQYEANNALAARMSPAPATVFDLTAATQHGVDISKFQKELTIQVNISEDNTDENLALHYYDTATDKWEKLPSTYDQNTSTLTGTTNHFTTYAVFSTSMPMITAVSPNPGSGYVGDNFSAKFTVSLSAAPGSVLFVHIGPPSDTHIALGVDHSCYSFPAGISISLPMTFTLPSPSAPMSRPYKVWAYYRPYPGSGGNCPTFYQSLPGEEKSSLDYAVEWMPKPPPQIVMAQPKNIHSLSALITWNTDIPSDGTFYLDIYDANGTYARTTEIKDDKYGTSHSVPLTELLPGNYYGGVVKSCNSVDCDSATINKFSTVSGCTQIKLIGENTQPVNSSALKTMWIRYDANNGYSRSYGYSSRASGMIYLSAMIDVANAWSSSPAWDSAINQANIGRLDYTINLPDGYSDGGILVGLGLFVGAERANTTYSGQTAKDSRTFQSYILPATVKTTEILINARITTTGKGNFNGTSCPTQDGASNGAIHLTYTPKPLAEGPMNPVTQEDVDKWDQIKGKEKIASGFQNAIKTAFGFIPYVDQVMNVSSVIDAISEIHAGHVNEFDDLADFTPRMVRGFNVYYSVYSRAGVRPDGLVYIPKTQRGFFMTYSYIGKGNDTNTGVYGDVLLSLDGINEEYPYWLIARKNIKLDDCIDLPILGGKSCSNIYMKSYSPIKYVVKNSAGKFIGENINEFDGVYEQYPEDNGEVGEEFVLPVDDYSVEIKGLKDSVFSLYITRPQSFGLQALYYDTVPVSNGEILNLSVPKNGYAQPITLADGTKVWPIDLVKPTTIISISPESPNGKNGWYVTNATISVESIDDLTGIKNTQCRVNQGEWFIYTTPFSVSSERVDNLVECFATDNYGNIEETKNIQFKLDKTPPVTSIMLDGQAGNHNWFKSDVTVNLNATDNVSGVDYIEYNLDGAGWKHYATPFIISAEGIHNLQYRASDIAGNLEVAKSQEIKIDKTAPILSAWVDKTVYVRLDKLILHYTASDAVSGIDFVTTDLAGDALENEVPYEILWIPVGKHTITVIAQDMAGWTTEQKIEIEVIATLDSLRALVLRLVELGEINEHTDTSLLAHIDGAIASYNRGQVSVAIHKLDALIHETEGQTSQHITERANDLLIGDTKYVEDHIK